MKVKITVILFLVFFVSCTKETIRFDIPTREIYNASMEAFENRKYNLAIEGFKRLVFEHPGSELIDESQFYLAESYLNIEDYGNAIVEFRFLIDNFPESPYLDDASFKLGLTYYRSSPPYYLEQGTTEDALKVIDRFIVHFPESEWVDEARKVREKCLDKLSRKELENGKLYYKLGHNKSAEIYLNNMLDTYPSSSYIDEAKFTLGLCYKQLDRKEEAEQIFKQLKEKRGPFSEKADKEFEELNKSR